MLSRPAATSTARSRSRFARARRTNSSSWPRRAASDSGCSPSTFLGEAQQTAAAWIRSGRLGTVRAVYAEVNWGRIETWHPAPEPFFDVGVLVDVGVYPLTLVTTMVGPARSVRAWGWELMPDRVTMDGTPFRIGSPDLIVAALELEGGAVLRLTASFYVGRPAKQTGGLEFHGDEASLALGNFQDFDATVEVGTYGETYEPVAARAAAISRHRMGTRRGGHGERDRRGTAASGERGAGGPRRRHPRGSRVVHGRGRSPDRDRIHVRDASADAVGAGSVRPLMGWRGLLPHDEEAGRVLLAVHQGPGPAEWRHVAAAP